MTPDRTWDPIRFQRGTRGFAAFVTLINGLAVLGFAAVAVPAGGLPEPLSSWIVILGVAAGIAHLVAVVGLVRARPWARSTVGYLAASGIGVAAFAMLMIARAEVAIVGAADASTLAFLAWMIGSWLVATRYAVKAYGWPADAQIAHGVAVAVVRPQATDTSPVLPSASRRIVAPRTAAPLAA